MRKLCEMCIQLDASFDGIFEPAVLLTGYGVIPRYPAELDLKGGRIVTPTDNESRHSKSIAQESQ